MNYRFIILLLLFLLSCGKENKESENEFISEDQSEVACSSSSRVFSSTTGTNAGSSFGGSPLNILNVGQLISLPTSGHIDRIQGVIGPTDIGLTVTLRMFPYSGSGDPDTNQSPSASSFYTSTSDGGAFSRESATYTFSTKPHISSGLYYVDFTTDADTSNSETVYISGVAPSTLGSTHYRYIGRDSSWSSDSNLTLMVQVYLCD